MPSFIYFLNLVEKQLNLILHPLMQFDNIKGKLKNDIKTAYGERKQLNEPNKPMLNHIYRVLVKYCVLRVVVMTSMCMKYVKFKELSMRDKWSVVKKSRSC